MCSLFRNLGRRGDTSDCTPPPSSFLPVMTPHRPGGHRGVACCSCCCWYHHKTLTMSLNFVSIHLWLLRDARETLRALSVMSRSLEPGDAESFCKFIWWNLPLLQHRIIARQHCLTPPNHQFQLILLAPCSCKKSLLLLTDCKVHRSLSS